MVTIDNITTVSESSQSRADVTVFDFKSNAVHVILDGNGDPWFLAKDVCNVLGTHTKDIRSILDEDEIRKIPNVDSIDIGGISTKNGGKAPPHRKRTRPVQPHLPLTQTRSETLPTLGQP